MHLLDAARRLAWNGLDTPATRTVRNGHTTT